MSFSVVTNVPSLIAQENLRVSSDFQAQTIQRLTSGYRINSSGDDAAGLAVANQDRSDVAELNQGVRNANDGISTLQIIDGGMNNIAKIMDRLKTLATQSANTTFSGQRSVLNDEFQRLIGEIDRQAQAIGLDQNGTFASTIGVYIGGGRVHGSVGAATNATVSFDLADATVDAKSLGLKGMQALGGVESATDIGAGSAHTSVAAILADTNNTTVLPNYSDFYFAGPGFAGSSKVKVSVNTQGVTDVNSLVTAINAAITSAGNGSSAAATAFKNAGIAATGHTDSTGKQQLAFVSSTTAFQVEAGDLVSNALMGNLATPSSNADASAMSSTVTGFANLPANLANAYTVPSNLTFRFTGAGLASPVDITLTAGVSTYQAALDELSTKVAANDNLKAAGITMNTASASNPLQFTSARGEKFNVMATGDTTNKLGFGSFVAGAAGAVDYATVTGAAYVPGTATTQGQRGTATLELSFNGAASSAGPVTVDLSGGDASGATVTGTATGALTDAHTLTVAIDGAAAHTFTFASDTVTTLQGKMNAYYQGSGLIATMDAAGHLVLTGTGTGAAHTAALSGNGAVDLGVGILGGTTYYGVSRSAASVAAALNTDFSLDTTLSAAGLKASAAGGAVTIASQNGTFFRVNEYGANADIGFGTAGGTFTGNTVSSAANSVAVSGGAANSTGLTFSSLVYGTDNQAITVTAVDDQGVQQSKTISLTDTGSTRTGRSLDEAINTINSALQQSNIGVLQKIVAVKDDASGVEKISFISADKSFQVSVGSTASGNGAGSQGSTLASTQLAGGSTADISTSNNAVSAIAALTAAVTALGSAQASIGRAQNVLGYAVGLAHSQISNLSAAESRIRDADMAAEAANLTKAQVMQQAGIAAMAQANSAPQAVLALLRG